MATLYTISQDSNWKVGDILSTRKLDASNIIHSPAIAEKEIVDYLNNSFPEGLSSRGWEYLVDTSKNNQRTSLEVLFEMIRQLKFPHRISRLNSLFGFKNLDQVNKKIAISPIKAYTIYQMECSDYFEADRNLLRCGLSPIEEILLAEKYWKGLRGEDPIFEFLVKFPVQITKKIEQPYSEKAL